MISLNIYNGYIQSSFLSKPHKTPKTRFATSQAFYRARKLAVRGCLGQESAGRKTERRTFLSLEEAGLVEISGLSSHEQFLCRLTVSSLNLLRVISEQEGCSIEELNAGRLCDWFVKDKLKREQNLESAVLQWDDSESPF